VEQQAVTRWLAFLAILAMVCGCSPDQTIDGGRLGQVRLAKPSGAARGLAFVFSDAAGWRGVDDRILQALAGEGALAVGVDTKLYLANLAKSSDERLYLVADVVDLGQQLQREAGSSTYLTPVLAGIGEGGTLAELILAQAPPVTIAGAVSIDPSAAIGLTRPLSAEPPARPRYHEDLQPDAIATLPGFWSVGLTPGGPADGRERVRRLSRAGMHIDIHEFSGPMTQTEGLVSLTSPHFLPAAASRTLEPSLPLVELPVGQPSDIMAILLSGDGGWADIDKVIAEDLQRDGVPVVGWDSLRYFWTRKTPEQTAQDLAGVMSTYMTAWHASKILLIGYSLGADVLPFAYNRLPEALQRSVVLVSLLGVEEKADFRVTVGGWLQLPPGDDALPTAPEIARIPPRLVQCFYGADEKHSACPGLAGKGIALIRTAGAHHFDGDYNALERRILAPVNR
jgi:type IV secretory pathway VirJ component